MKWIKETTTTGLLCIVLTDVDTKLAIVSYSDGSWYVPKGWYWAVIKNNELGILKRDASDIPLPSVLLAKKQAKAFIDNLMNVDDQPWVNKQKESLSWRR